MATFLPWSESTVQMILESSAKGNMPVIDLELSALCEHRLVCGGCLYCDSATGNSHLNELSIAQITAFILQAKQDLHLRWLYCCGLGEPSNDPNFFPIVEVASSQGIALSFFTNGFNYSYDDLCYLYQHGVSLLIKCDSLNPEVFGKLLGLNDLATVQTIYRTIKMAIDIGFATPDSTGSTRLALSIVPTKYNKTDLLEVVRFCKNNQLFPLIGQLEQAGRGREIFDKLALSRQELSEIKLAVDQILQSPYEIPVCPAGISGIHINNIGECVVHQTTGLSCAWFELAEPRVEILGNIKEQSAVELWNLVRLYRKNRLPNVQKFFDTMSLDALGGCGGKNLLAVYLRTMQGNQ